MTTRRHLSHTAGRSRAASVWISATSFLARYSGRTLEAYRHDLRGFFQWATDTGLDVLTATRGHIELFRT